jgi:hypothetical protein
MLLPPETLMPLLKREGLAQSYHMLQLQMCTHLLEKAEEVWEMLNTQHYVDWGLLGDHLYNLNEEVPELYQERELLERKDTSQMERALVCLGDPSALPVTIVQELLEAVLQALGEIQGGEEEVDYEVDDMLRSALLHCAKMRWE